MSRGDVLDALGLSLASGACEISLVRHADALPERDVEHRAYDEYHAHPLSARGRAQAEATAERCAGVGIAAVYCSPVPRARETAETIASRCGAALHEDTRLEEVGIGALDGTMTLRERLDALAAIALRDGSWTSIPGTESSESVRGRMRAALDAIAERHRGSRLVVVSHAGAINAYLGDVAGTPHDFIFPLANCSISMVRVASAHRLLMSANDVGHLRTPSTSAP